ncbi:MAG: hydantoinase B/oxoprolinase family protein [Acidobacteria bacterium]|nr:hydantoinase B/oxoprolinase family protein [Acidobacteriota bacterium]
MDRGWWFWIDQGGTFTDVVAMDPQGGIHLEKLPSRSLAGKDPITRAVQQLAGEAPVTGLKIGTTVGTNALLERRGERVLFLTTSGFADALLIGTQHRTDLFDLNIQRTQPLYDSVVEARERMDAQGRVIDPLDEPSLQASLTAALEKGYTVLAIGFVNAYANPSHERRAAEIAMNLGFKWVTCSTDVSRMVKWLPRSDTAVLNAYLSNKLMEFVRRTQQAIGKGRAWAMTSRGELTSLSRFLPHESLLSGPAGGVAGTAAVARRHGIRGFVSLDMGGTSTDVAAFADRFEIRLETDIDGVRVHSPTLMIHTIAAGGGSLLKTTNGRMVVGPQSAGADPGPACYGRGGPAALTDCQVVLGFLDAQHFPACFGPNADQPLNEKAARVALAELLTDLNEDYSLERLAFGYVQIAVHQMASAIRRVTLARGQDARQLVLLGFGGAAGQYATMIADEMDMDRVMVPAHASLLSAVGMSEAEISATRQRTFCTPLTQASLKSISGWCDQIEGDLDRELEIAADDSRRKEVMLGLRVDGMDDVVEVPFSAEATLRHEFERGYEQRYGLESEHRPLVIEYARLSHYARIGHLIPAIRIEGSAPNSSHRSVYYNGHTYEYRVVWTAGLASGAVIDGPALLVDTHTTVSVHPGWQAQLLSDGSIDLHRVSARKGTNTQTAIDPVLLEVYRNGFQEVAESMGVVLKQTAMSVNIKERLDFSCAIFDSVGRLIANAPHMPVHIGSMDMCVKALIERETPFSDGDCYAVNDPAMGGTHLPDITVVTAVFVAGDLAFFVASRGHHADIGGTVPGSMPSASKTLEEEGVVFSGFLIKSQGRFLSDEVREHLSSHRYPARNPSVNLSDLKAQIAANMRGRRDLLAWAERVGWASLLAYMTHIRNHAAASIRRALCGIRPSRWSLAMDNGAVISVDISRRTDGLWTIDFEGTSAQTDDNMNAPLAITRAAVLYVLRTLISEAIPLNAGCMEPVRLRVPAGSVLNPGPGAAVAAGNVETSQHIVDLLLAAFGTCAASQGTMNNFSFGDGTLQYYETICGGTGAGPGFHGADAIHSHMTNSRLTDPEILERVFPVRLLQFGIRRGSGGLGRFCGGDGAVRELMFLRPMTCSLLTTRRKTRPFGIMGGSDGLPGQNSWRPKDGTWQPLQGCDEVDVQEGDRILIKTPGGGGFGEKDGSNESD